MGISSPPDFTSVMNGMRESCSRGRFPPPRKHREEVPEQFRQPDTESGRSLSQQLVQAMEPRRSWKRTAKTAKTWMRDVRIPLVFLMPRTTSSRHDLSAPTSMMSSIGINIFDAPSF